LRFVSDKSKSLNAIRKGHLKMLGIVPDEKELAIHNLISNGEKPVAEEQLKSAEAWLRKIIHSNNKNKIIDRSYLEKIVLERWLRFCFNFFGGKKGISYFYRSEIFHEVKLPVSRKLELFKQIYYSYKRRN
jgi:hypothetical protein